MIRCYTWCELCSFSPSGCNPDIFRKNVAVGKSVTTPCGSIHPAFNGLGNIRWTCVDHLTWDGDLSECTMMLSYNKSILLFLYRVVIPPGSEITPLVKQPAPLEQDVSQLCDLPPSSTCPCHTPCACVSSLMLTVPTRECIRVPL